MANADTPKDALAARNNGAEGIGLCRTEHMVCISYCSTSWLGYLGVLLIFFVDFTVNAKL
jgi:hypothetical protein